MSRDQKKTAWVVSVDMGYGHQRAAAALLPWAESDKIITANNYQGIPEHDRKFWERSEKLYEALSRLKSQGWLGRTAFNIFDYFQRIERFYPLHANHRPTLQLLTAYRELERGWGKHLIETLGQSPRPLITPFPVVAFMAERWGYPAPIYCITTDADINRAWAALEPAKSSIRYLAATQRDVDRLAEYGVLMKNIILTGFPLPLELVGPHSEIAKRNLSDRLARLDPKEEYRKKFAPLVKSVLGHSLIGKEKSPVRLTFAVGGAGAQTEIGFKALNSLASKIRDREVEFNLVAGVSKNVAEYFNSAVSKIGLNQFLGQGVKILCADNKDDYFRKFNQLLAETDILWTKPSELSFFAALGLPILMAPPIGSQEVQNRKWLYYLDAATDSLDPSDIHEWLEDMLEGGILAERAMNGYVKGEREGTKKIVDLVCGQKE